MAFALLKHGLVDCLGTDTHNPGERAPDYAAAKQAIEREGYGAKFEEIQEKMHDILDDKLVRTGEGKPLKKFFGVYY